MHSLVYIISSLGVIGLDISGIYRHFKGKQYRVFSQVCDMDTGDTFVFYQQLYAPYQYWIRPWDNFFSNIEFNGSIVSRFVKIQEIDEPFSLMTSNRIQIIHSETLRIYKLQFFDDKYFVKCTKRIAKL